jgi:hypothetical protein
MEMSGEIPPLYTITLFKKEVFWKSRSGILRNFKVFLRLRKRAKEYKKKY